MKEYRLNPDQKALASANGEKTRFMTKAKAVGASVAVLAGTAFAMHNETEATQANQAYLSEHFTQDELAGVALAPSVTITKQSTNVDIDTAERMDINEGGAAVKVDPVTGDRIPAPVKRLHKTPEH